MSLELLPAEVLQNVCDLLRHVRRNTYASTGQGRGCPTCLGLNALLVLARTSRVFHNYALNAIWGTLPGYAPLVYLLPDDAWMLGIRPATNSKDFSVTSSTITRPLTENDLERLKHYSPRVKRIIHRVDVPFPIRAQEHQCLPSVLEAFAAFFNARPDQAFLPNLRVLHLNIPSDSYDVYPSLHVLFGPLLRDFDNSTSTQAPELFEGALSKLAEKSPGLRAFQISLWSWEPPLADVVSHAVCKFQHLTRVSVDMIPISAEGFAHLATLPSLRDVGLKMGLRTDEQYRDMLDKAKGTRFFPRVFRMNLQHQFGLAIPALALRVISSPYLTIISIHVSEDAVTSQDVQELTAAITSRRRRLLRLKIVEIYLASIRDGDAITMDALDPLLDLVNLRLLKVIAKSGRFAIDNRALGLAALAWPDMRHLELGPDRMKPDVTPPATLEGLILLALRCPQLHTLGVALDTTLRRLPGFYDYLRPGAGKSQGRLETLKVGRSKVANPAEVAAFLSDLFPNLCNIESDFAFEEEIDEYEPLTPEERTEYLLDAAHRARWDSVEQDHIPLFVNIRKQERKWANARRGD
ncbi:hypothetical protein C8Q79DRAFT_906622 [Trametes meyenii]|nr:hypothetical protein C8Q79DRAFT_906622 [Trametes meyenii]